MIDLEPSPKERPIVKRKRCEMTRTSNRNGCFRDERGHVFASPNGHRSKAERPEATKRKPCDVSNRKKKLSKIERKGQESDVEGGGPS